MFKCHPSQTPEPCMRKGSEARELQEVFCQELPRPRFVLPSFSFMLSATGMQTMALGLMWPGLSPGPYWRLSPPPVPTNCRIKLYNFIEAVRVLPSSFTRSEKDFSCDSRTSPSRRMLRFLFPKETDLFHPQASYFFMVMILLFSLMSLWFSPHSFAFIENQAIPDSHHSFPSFPLTHAKWNTQTPRSVHLGTPQWNIVLQ